ncbi:TadE/TadG family type IV pilus assembly protein [Croceicoccus mobilis]|uniref:TadE-like domain-containing protein n=1 Tax=Croceicoccus mobilis TaxID=1703339 RepID=A0A917DQC0_9SPHN|nr:TadE family protein [Croceicoccus mobilis]GGD56337.1 hypothetical protein GCM10010990_01940 [Croceicoccus mobilis]
MKRLRRFRQDEDGAVAVEFALWTVTLFFVIAAGLDFGLYFIQRSHMDESLSATAISAFDARQNVAFTSLPQYARALADDDAMTVAVSCNGSAGSCTNLSRTCSCLNGDGSFTGQACGTVCTANGTSAGYYLTLDASSDFTSVIVPSSMVGNGRISRSTTVRLE